MDYVKTPGEVLDYAFDFATRYLGESETIVSHSLTADAGIVLGAHNEANGVVTFFVSGGTVRTNYGVTCQIITSEGRTVERSDVLKIVAKR